jgi:hypothetical protein
MMASNILIPPGKKLFATENCVHSVGNLVGIKIKIIAIPQMHNAQSAHPAPGKFF